MSCTCDLYRRFGERKIWFTKVNPDCPDHGHLISLAKTKDTAIVDDRIKHLEIAFKKMGEEFERLKTSIKEAQENAKITQEDAAGDAWERDTYNNA